MLRIANTILAVAVMAGAAGLYVVKTDTRRLEAHVHAQERTHERLVEDIAVLRAERAHLKLGSQLLSLAKVVKE